MLNNTFAVILAGGSGTRFWPKSRHLSPKQLCKIGDPERTMIEITLDRLDGFVPPERRIIVTHREQADSTRTIVGKRAGLILAEPEARNTAAALALAALEIRNLAKENASETVMISLHADHVIRDVDTFRSSLKTARGLALDNYLTLIGIVPTRPETGFGYIEQGAALGPTSDHSFRVQSFQEKPPLATAQRYFESGRYFWNAGYFVWKVDTFLRELATHAPATLQPLEQIFKGASWQDVAATQRASVYGALPKIAIDNALIEKSQHVAVVSADMGWEDVGSWDALDVTVPGDALGNRQLGDTIVIDSKNVTIDSDGPLVACVGVEDLVIVASKGAILVCPKNRAQDVKKVVESLQKAGRKNYL